MSEFTHIFNEIRTASHHFHPCFHHSSGEILSPFHQLSPDKAANANHRLPRPHPDSRKRLGLEAAGWHSDLHDLSKICPPAPSLGEKSYNISPTQINLFCHDQVQGWGMLRCLALLTLTSRQMGPVSGSVFPLALGSCRGAPGSHFHQGNHTHFPTDLLRKMLHQSRTLPRSRSKPSAALCTLLTWRGRRPGWLFPSNGFRLKKSVAKLWRELYEVPISSGWDGTVGSGKTSQICSSLSFLGLWQVGFSNW